jgi:8-oxo-dGTP diphosphatase
MRVVVVAAVIESNHRFLVTRRQPGVHLAGMWEFPGGKTNPNETRDAALRRELLEELDVEAAVGARVYRTEHVYPDRTIELDFYRCDIKGAPRPLQGQEMRWVPRAGLLSLDFPPADAELIALLTASDAR